MNAGKLAADVCHAHVIDPVRFPLVPGAGYQPRRDEVGPRDVYAGVLAAHGVTHALLVQPSGYGFDNRALVDALSADPGRRKGIAVVPPEVTDAALQQLVDAGVIGVRLNLGAFDPTFLERPGALAFLERMRERDLFVEVYAPAAKWERISRVLAESEVKVIVDHMGEPDVRQGVAQAGFVAMLALGRGGNACVKLSAAYRVAEGDPPYRDVVPFAQACVEAFGLARCVWGSDWPFINASRRPTYADQQAWLDAIAPAPADRQRILVDTPRRLFGFAAEGEDGT